MRALITGANGFVGKYLKQELEGAGIEVLGTDFRGEDVILADLLDQSAAKGIVNDSKPDLVFHLAGQSAVGFSWKNPTLTFDVNVNATINLLDAVRESGQKCRMVIIGSADEYGKVRPEDCPIKETFVPEPESPYAISKFTQEKMALLYAKAYGMDIVLTRSFNHSGPGQQRGFVLPDFASQIAQIERGAEPQLLVGNLSAERDFSDVRDTVRAYRLLSEKGKCGRVYNVGSGRAYVIKDMLQMLISLSKVKITVVEDETKMRPVDTPLIVGDIGKLQQDTGFEPEYKIEDTLGAILDYWRKAAGSEG